MFCDGFHGVEEEIILGLYKSVSKYEDSDIFEIYKLEKADFPEFPEIENCIVVTNQNVYIIHLKSNILKIALDLILEAELEKAEKICSIFEINLQKLLELAGDIKLNASEFPTAFALYKLSKVRWFFCFEKKFFIVG